MKAIAELERETEKLAAEFMGLFELLVWKNQDDTVWNHLKTLPVSRYVSELRQIFLEWKKLADARDQKIAKKNDIKVSTFSGGV